MLDVKILISIIFVSFIFKESHGNKFNVGDMFNFLGKFTFNPAEFFINVNKKDIFFNVFTPNHPYPREIDDENLHFIESDKPVKVLLHGWVGNENIRTYKNITNEYMKKGNYNIVQVDWRNIAVLPYAVASVYTKEVGKVVSELIYDIHIKRGISLENIHLIGISLGAHVAGLAGKRIQKRFSKKLGRITALDPAGPLFEFPPAKKEDKLTSDDAEIVDIIHTDGGIVGAMKPMGTIDFYPNGGIRPQEGCPLLPRQDDLKQFEKVADSFFCGHYKAVEYFIRSINSVDFVGTKCKSWFNFKLGNCKGNDQNIMGENLIPDRHGSFYLIMK